MKLKLFTLKSLQEIHEDPARAMRKYAHDKDIMAVVGKLAAAGMRESEDSPPSLFRELNTTPQDVAKQLFGNRCAFVHV